ncbi:ammonium transporter, partial [Lactobacillus nasalidis]
MNTANTVFLIIAAVLVLMMTPGLAFFYGGLVSKKNVVNTMLSVFIICALAIVLFVAFGYEMCFDGNIAGIFGHIRHIFLSGADLNRIVLKDQGITAGSYLLFEMMFAIITPALFVGATVGRMRFNFLLVFVVFWSVLVYYPLVHMVWGTGGLLAGWGILDFAGGTVVHINAGITALVLSIFLGPRYRKQSQAYSLPWVLLGTAILWLGWYGFNAGSAFGMNSVALTACLTTTVAAASSMMTWLLLEESLTGKVSLDGICTGTLCGLVGITPGAGYESCVGALFTGALCSLASYFFISRVKGKLSFDDPLDAFGCHGVSGIVGSL